MITCVENRFASNLEVETHYMITPPKFRKLGQFQGSGTDKKEKYLALDFGIS